MYLYTIVKGRTVYNYKLKIFNPKYKPYSKVHYIYVKTLYILVANERPHKGIFIVLSNLHVPLMH